MSTAIKRFDAVIAKNELARLLRQIQAGEYESINDLPLAAMRFNLREIEIYTGELNQPSISDILESEMEL